MQERAGKVSGEHLVAVESAESAILAASPDFVSLMTLRGEYVLASPAAFALLGYQPQEIVGLRLADLEHPDDAREPDATRIQHRLRTKRGEYVWVESTRARVDGEAFGRKEPLLLSFTRDISDRKRTEELLLAGQLAVLDRSREPALIQRKGMIVYANAAAAGTLRLGAEVLVGKRALELVAELDRAAEEERFASALQSGAANAREVSLMLGDGSEARMDAYLARTTFGGDAALIWFLREAPASKPSIARARQDCPRARVLVVDDEPVIGSVLRRILSEHDVEHSLNAQAAIDRLTKERFDVVVCDLMMPGMSGIDLYAKLVTLAPEIVRRIVFLTGGAFTPRAREFLASVPNTRIEKPFDAASIRKAVKDAIGTAA